MIVSERIAIAKNEGAKMLDLSNLGIRDLKEEAPELCQLTHLEVLNLSKNEIKKIDILGNLVALKELNLAFNHISLIKPLRHLVNLKHLDLYHNKIANLSALEHLVNLEKLCLSHNKIKDLTPLSGLNNLKSLDLWHNKIADIKPLCQLTNLINLSLQFNDLWSIPAEIQALVHLKELYLGENALDEDDYTDTINVWLPNTEISWYEDDFYEL